MKVNDNTKHFSSLSSPPPPEQSLKVMPKAPWLDWSIAIQLHIWLWFDGRSFGCWTMPFHLPPCHNWWKCLLVLSHQLLSLPVAIISRCQILLNEVIGELKGNVFKAFSSTPMKVKSFTLTCSNWGKNWYIPLIFRVNKIQKWNNTMQGLKSVSQYSIYNLVCRMWTSLIGLPDSLQVRDSNLYRITWAR